MKRRYSPAARKARLRALHNKPVVREIEQTPAVYGLIYQYRNGFLTAQETMDRILETMRPQASDPERCRNCGGRPVFKDGLCKDCYFEWKHQGYHGPERPEEWTPGSAEEWARSLTPPSPPWEGGAA